MSKNSKISWTHHTFNPWHGCSKVSAGCANCYAEAFSRRLGNDVWGRNKPRRFFGDDHWAKPIAWDKAAEKAGERHRVFCDSMCDIFEDHSTVGPARAALFNLIECTPHLIWMILTKRPENINRMVPWKTWPENVWLGVSVETQRRAAERLPVLINIPAYCHFLSIEPLLGSVDLFAAVFNSENDNPKDFVEFNKNHAGLCFGVDWVIVGGESGPRRRTMDPAWARAIRDQCASAKVPFYFKQFSGLHPAKTPPELDGKIHSEIPKP